MLSPIMEIQICNSLLSKKLVKSIFVTNRFYRVSKVYY